MLEDKILNAIGFFARLLILIGMMCGCFLLWTLIIKYIF